jgi:hypothetical protein
MELKDIIKIRLNLEEFIIPKPSGEPEAEYIKKCMDAIGGEYDTPEQAIAVCYAQLEK